MRAGTLRDRVSILVGVPASDPEWGDGETLQSVAEVAASVIARTGSESTKDDGTAASTSYDITIRYRDDVTSTNRLTWNGTTLEVVSVIDPDGRRRQLKIDARVTQ